MGAIAPILLSKEKRNVSGKMMPEFQVFVFSKGVDNNGSTRLHDCSECEGRGWVLLEVEKQMGVLVRFCQDKPVIRLFKAIHGELWVASLLTKCSHGTTPEEALAHAICRYMGSTNNGPLSRF